MHVPMDYCVIAPPAADSDGAGPPHDNRRMMIRVWEYDVQAAAAPE